MFYLKELREKVYFRRQEVLGEILDSGKHFEVFYSPGHLFLLVEGGKSLQTFDVVAPSNQIFKVEEGNLILQTPDDPIVKLIFTKDSNLVYIVFSRGRIELWKFSSQSSAWWCMATEELLTNESNDPTGDLEGVANQSKFLLDVLFHPLHNAIYWCEVVNKEEVKQYRVCGRTFHLESEEGRVEGEGDNGSILTIGSMTQLISHSPPCSLHISGDCLLLYFRAPCPAGWYMKWHQASRDLVTYIHPRGRLHSDKVYLQPVNFKQLAFTTASVWSQVAPIVDWTVVRHSTNENSLFIDHGGVVWNATGSQEFQEVCQLQSWPSDDVINVMATLCQYGILVSNKLSLWLYDLESGEVVQEFNDLTSDVHHVWTSTYGVNAGVHAGHQLLTLQVLPSVTWQPSEYGARLLSNSGQNLQATLLQLEDIKNQPSLAPSEKHLPIRSILENLQSPALLLSLLHKGRNSGTPPALFQDVLNIAKSDLLETPLTLDLAPLVSKFLDLEKFNWEQFVQPHHMSSHSVDDEVSRALHLIVENDHQVAYQQFTYLATRWPARVAMATVTTLGLDKPDDEPFCTDFWESLRTQDTDCFHGNTLMAAIAHHLLLQSPDHLMNYLDLVWGGGKDEHAAFKGVGQGPFFRQILRHLPHPRLSVNVPSAAAAVAKVLARGGGADCHQECLGLLVKHGLWREAVNHLKLLHRQHPKYGRWFQIVFTALLKAGVFTEFCEDLLEISPENMSGVSLLHQLKKGHHPSSFIFCKVDSQEDIKFGRVREQLQKFFTQ